LYLLPGPLKQFAQLFPEVKLSVQRGSLDEIPRKVLDREVQIGFVRRAPAFQELVSVDVYDDEMVLIASRKHALAAKESVSMQDLNDISLIVHNQCRWTEDTVMRLFRQHSIDYRVVAELCSVESIKSLVLADVGVAIVPRIVARRELRQKRLVALSVPEFKLPLQTVMIFRRDYKAETANQLIEIIRNQALLPGVRPDRMAV
jgi:DNA-binding transcriptional LysR family regulator